MTTRRTVAIAGVALALSGIVLPLTVRDRLPVIAILYYATPPPVVAWAALVGAFAWSGRARRFLIAAAIMIAIGAAAAMTEMQTPRSGNVRLMVWNVASASSFERVRAEIERANADVVGLVETKMSEVVLDGWSASSVRSKIALLARGEIEEGTCPDLGRHASCRRFTVRIRERTLDVVVFDSAGNPLRDRRHGLQRLAAETASPNVPTIVMGDFNAPAGSVWFDDLRPRYRNGFEQAGRGWSATFPWPLPVLQIDHIWCSDDLVITGATHGWSIRSDHRPVIVDLQ